MSTGDEPPLYTRYGFTRTGRPDTPLVVDAGLGRPSHAAAVMELGYDAVLLNTAVAKATDPVASSSAYLYRFISGSPTVAMVAAVAGLEPHTAPNAVQADTVAMANPPRVLPRNL